MNNDIIEITLDYTATDETWSGKVANINLRY